MNSADRLKELQQSNGHQTPAELIEESNQQIDSRVADQFLRDAQSIRKRLDAALEQIDELPNVADRSIALNTLRKQLGLSKDDFAQFVRELTEAKEEHPSESFDELMAEDDDEPDILTEDLLAAGLVLVAAEGHAGKSNTAYQLAEAVSNGAKFAGQFQCKQSNVLIVQLDESLRDAKKKWRKLGLKPAKGALTIKWNFRPMMFPELRQWIKDANAKLVILDSLLTIAGGVISPKDAEFGLLIYRLNQLAGELGITIVCLHHVTKSQGKQREEISKDDIYGTAYVYNGASDAWGLWRKSVVVNNRSEERFYMRCLKSRSGMTDIGTTYVFGGSEEDNRLTYSNMDGRSATLNELNTNKSRVRHLLEGGKGKPFTPKMVNESLRLGNEDYARRICGQLFQDTQSGVDRKRGESTGGRAPYQYYWRGVDGADAA